LDDADAANLPAAQPEEKPNVGLPHPNSPETKPLDEFQVLSPSRRRIAEIYQIGNSDLGVFRDARPLEESEHETLFKLLFRLPSIPAGDVAQWAETSTDWSEIEQDPWRHRASVFSVQGYVKFVSSVPMAEDLVERFGFDKFYRCELELVGSDRIAVIYCRDIPEAWPIDKRMHEFAAAQCWFLKTGPLRGDRHEILLAANRIAWHPVEATDGMGINPGHLLLAKHGMDIGLWKYVKNGQGIGEWFIVKNGKNIGIAPRNKSREEFLELLSGEVEAFYQMLIAASDVPKKALKKAARAELAERGLEKLSIVPLFNEPKTQHARVLTLSGVARRATKVVVGQSSDFPGQASDVKQRFGLDHYYEVHFFTSDSQNEPLIFITKNLPATMPLGEKIHANVRITGFYFKKYAYPANIPNKETNEYELIKRESPLLVGGVVEHLSPEQSRNTFAGLMAGGFFLVALGGIWLGLYLLNSGDRKFRRDTVSRVFAVEPGQSLDELADAPIEPVEPRAE
jgi:hypothetical protein